MRPLWGWLVLGGILLTASALGCRPAPTGPTAGASPPAAADDDPGPDLFEDVTVGSGIDFAYRNGEDAVPPPRAILEALGGGVALIDYDRDSLLDVYVPGGGHFTGPDSREIRGHAGRLYRNLGGWKFADVTKQCGLESLAGGRPWFYSHGAAVADFDRDGWPDLLVTGWGRVALFRNVPDGKGGRTFEDVSAKAKLDQGITWATSAAWADFDGDGYPDLYVCQYVDWSFANHPTCVYDGKHGEPCTPKRFRGLTHKLYRNAGDGTFADVTAAAGLCPGGDNASKGLGVVAVDVNLDGRPDLYVANDTVDNFLYVNRSTPGAIRFAEVGLLAGVARDGNGAPNGSMGVDAGDPTGSGLPALWVTNYENESHGLYRNMSSRERTTFLYLTPAAGLGTLGRDFVGWGTGFVDLDHHGYEDLVVVNGHVIRHHPLGQPRPQRPVLLRNWGGRFREVSDRGGPYFRGQHTARGLALGDLDNDGSVDLVVSHLNEPVRVLRNRAGAGYHWLGVELADRRHADLAGARVTLEAGGRTQTRFAKGGGSYLSSPDRRLVFGLGAADRVDRLTVVWPDGTRREWTTPAIDGYHTLTPE